jgi:hypothetical protein
MGQVIQFPVVGESGRTQGEHRLAESIKKVNEIIAQMKKGLANDSSK